MPDNVTVDNGGLTDYIVSSDEGVGGQVQRVKLAYSADGAETHVGADADGLLVNLGANNDVVVSDGGDVISVDDGGASLTVDGTVAVSGAVDTELTTADLDTGVGTDTRAVVGLVGAASGGGALIEGTAANGLEVDVTRVQGTVHGGWVCGYTAGFHAALTELAGAIDVEVQVDVVGALPTGTNNIGDVDVATVPAPLSTQGGGTEATALRVTIASDSTGLVSVDDNGGSITVDGTVTVTDGLNIEGDVAHDSADGTSNPVKVGARAVNAFPTAVANNDRANALADLFGRLLVSHIDPAQRIFKAATYTATQTGTALWTPGAGKKIAVTHVVIATFGTTAGRVTVWFGDNSPADTTYTEGTDQPVFDGNFVPGASSAPGAILQPTVPIFSENADFILRVTTDAAISVRVQAYGYEY